MTNEVRKPPREFWAYGNMISIHREMFRRVGISEAYDSAIRLREILPGDDSIRDLALAKIRLKRAEDAAYHALLHMSAWLGIPDKKREQFIEDEMGNVRFCCQNNLPQDLERIERENPPKQDEGK